MKKISPEKAYFSGTPKEFLLILILSVTIGGKNEMPLLVDNTDLSTKKTCFFLPINL